MLLYTHFNLNVVVFDIIKWVVKSRISSCRVSVNVSNILLRGWGLVLQIV